VGSGGSLSLIRALQLASGTLPVGAYAYSQGLEWAVEAGWVSNASELGKWLDEQLMASIATTDLPVFVRLHAAALDRNEALMDGWSRCLIAARETSELVADDCARGAALARLLTGLGIEAAARWCDRADTPFAALAALAAVAWDITRDDAAVAYTWGWLEGQVLAGVKLIPLGQLAGQRLLFDLSARIPQALAHAKQCRDDEIGGTLPLLALASSLHETQYTRLFRS
jgi:urease accessory protein